MIEYFLAAVFLAFAAIAIAVALYIKAQGEQDVRFLPEQKSKLTCELIDDEKAVFSLLLPYQNFGKQEGIMTDAFARVLLPKEQFDMAKVSSHFENSLARRDDDYVEAFIIRIGVKGNFVLTLEITPSKNRSMQEVLENIVDMTIDIYYEVVGRTYPMLRKDSLTLLLEEFQQAATEGAAKK